MSTFPEHVDNIKNMKNLGFEVGDCYENGEVTLESWRYDNLVYLMSDLIGRIQQLEQDNEILKASLSLCQEQNREMLEMFKEARHEIAQGVPIDGTSKVLEDIDALIAKIESQKEGE